MRHKHPSRGQTASSGSSLVTLIVALTLGLIVMLVVATSAALSENAPVPPASSAPSNQASTPAGQKPAAPPPAVTILNNHEVQGILGREVLDATNENMGRIVDVIVDRGGKVRAAIIDFGGFLGVGSRKIAVDWSALHFPPPGKPDAKITLELTRDQVRAAPEYLEGKPVVVLSALGKLEPLPSD